MNWENPEKEDLKAIANCIGGRSLSGIFKVLAEDYANWIAGMPDLLLWNLVEMKAKVVEVKGPRDR